MKFYKAMSKRFTCLGFKYEIGKIYELPKDEKLELGEKGFHFCDVLNNCFNYYYERDCIICEVEPLGKIVGDTCSNEYATDKIKIIRQLSDDEIEKERYNIQDGVKRIGVNCFRGCTSLKEIIIPDSVTSIGDSCFRDCEDLESIIIPDSVTAIERYAFYSCPSLKSVTIPNSVKHIDSDTFGWCINLQKIYVSKDFNFDILKGCVLEYYVHTNKYTNLLDKVDIIRI